MHYDNGFRLLFTVFSTMNHRLGGLGPQAQDHAIPFHFSEGEPLPDFYLGGLAIRSDPVSRRY